MASNHAPVSAYGLANRSGSQPQKYPWCRPVDSNHPLLQPRFTVWFQNPIWFRTTKMADSGGLEPQTPKSHLVFKTSPRSIPGASLSVGAPNGNRTHTSSLEDYHADTVKHYWRIGAGGGSRTHTGSSLNRMTLPIGLHQQK